ncbi:Beta-lactamase class C-like and penicillin binding proteins (PBPs) superfamily [hydrothermal vent metagenome]|uniref:Beta-lactamase class C-like and penicillin binding proteins (PBPs) superfamily n=1 Tax=hydrothermal vent metagenome TaxID=652676 RepID=A0A3B0ZND5_9ZZZZ
MSDYEIRQLGFSPDKFQEIEAYLQATIDKKRASGIVLCLARETDDIIYRSVGLSSIEDKLACTPQTLYRIASLTKPVITVALMMLLEKGLCAVDDPVEKWLPEVREMQVLSNPQTTGDDTSEQSKAIFEPIKEVMTLKHLLNHTSGLCYDFNAPTKIKQEYSRSRIYEACETTADFAHKLLQLPLAFQPGSGYFYGFSTDVLGHIVELISGQPLDEYLQQHLFEPLNMVNSGFSVAHDETLQVASMYGASTNEEGQHQLKLLEAYASNAVFNAPKIFSGGGGMLSTPDDYMKFLRMLMNGGLGSKSAILQENSIEMMTKNYLQANQMPYNIGCGINYDTEGYGFGFNLKVLLNPRTKDYVVSEGEYGWAGSTNTYAWIDSRRDLAVAVFSQYVPFACYPLEQELKKLIYDAMVY